MKKYDALSECAKCGDIGATTTHQTEGRKQERDQHPIPDHMERKCTTCGFYWKEAPLDA